MSEIVNVPFYGQNLVAVEKNGRIYVAMKPIVEAIGLEWNKQLELIKRDSVLSEGMTVMGIPSSGGVQKSICLPW